MLRHRLPDSTLTEVLRRRQSALLTPVISVVVLCAGASAQQPQVTAEQLLRQYSPVQKNVEYSNPKDEELSRCQVKIEKASYVVYGPSGEPLRRFADSNGDSSPDTFSYFLHGLEVYRERDTNGDYRTRTRTRPDEFRWMNWGGTRWGLDSNEDGQIDSWKVLSAPEAAQLAVEALIAGDLATLKSVLLNDEDIQQLGIPEAIAVELRKSVSDLPGKARAAVSQPALLNTQSKWFRFDTPAPGLIPAEQIDASDDLTVYQNAIAYVENGPQKKIDAISIGEMVQVGNVWKLVNVPAPFDAGNEAIVAMGGILMRSMGTSAAAPTALEMSEAMLQLLTDLQKLDESAPQGVNTDRQQFMDYYVKRSDIAEKLIQQSRTAEEQTQWLQQYTDSLANATQAGGYPRGLARLKALETALKERPSTLQYVQYRRVMAEYAVRMTDDETQEGEAEAQKARVATQEWFLQELKSFAESFPDSADTPEAIFQLAMSSELMGQLPEASEWYRRLADNYPENPQGKRAQGALKRLNLKGNPVQLTGRTLQGTALNTSQFRGKVVLLVFWAAYAQPVSQDISQINAVYSKYQKQGFEIIGVNMDRDPNEAVRLINASAVRWPSLREPAAEAGDNPGDFGFGIVALPTMLLIDQAGLAAGGITPVELDAGVSALLEGKPLESIRQQPAESETSDSK